MFARRIFSLGLTMVALGVVGPAMAHLDANYGKLPLSFESNRGQSAGSVRFLSRGPGYTLFLTPTEAILNLRKPVETSGISGVESARSWQGLGRAVGSAKAKAPLPKASDWGQGTSSAIAALVLPTPDFLFAGHAGARATLDQDQSGATTLRVTLDGANPNPVVAGQERLPGIVNYLVGKDPRGWHTGIQTYGKVAYSQVYPGIDLVYYGNQRQLEHDFIVAPGADPSRIRLAFVGAESLSLDPQGNLLVKTRKGEVTLHKPLIYQEVNGTRKPIEGHYLLHDALRVGFQLANWDRARPLVIDPVLSYASYLGGQEEDYVSAIAVDRLGQAYITGTTKSSDFPIAPKAFLEEFRGAAGPGPGYVAFVAKFSADGSSLMYSTYLSGYDYAAGSGIAIDNEGQAVVSGSTLSDDFPTTPGAFQTDFNGHCGGVFVTKLKADGSGLIYSTLLGVNAVDFCGSTEAAIALDRSGQAYVMGSTQSDDLPTTPGAFQASINGTRYGGDGAYIEDAYVAKFNADASGLVYLTYLGGSHRDWYVHIAVDNQGQAVVTGATGSYDFPTTPGAFQTYLRGGFDAFVTKIRADGTGLVYSTYLGGSDFQYAGGIATDAQGHAYVAGSTTSYDFPTTPGAFQTESSGGDGFIAKLDSEGSALLYSTYLGGGGAASIAVDEFGQAYVTGGTASAAFPTTFGAFQTELRGNSDAFISKLNSDGSALLYSTYLGGSIDQPNVMGEFGEGGSAIAVDASGQVYVTGITTTLDFPITPGAFQTELKDSDSGFRGGDAFIAKFAGFGVPNLATFSPRVKIDFGPKSADDAFEITARFTLDARSNGVDPRHEAITLTLGDFSTTIPSGSFKTYRQSQVPDKVRFSGMINQARMTIDIYDLGGNHYLLWAKGSGAELGRNTAPLRTTLAIGDEGGQASLVPTALSTSASGSVFFQDHFDDERSMNNWGGVEYSISEQQLLIVPEGGTRLWEYVGWAVMNSPGLPLRNFELRTTVRDLDPDSAYGDADGRIAFRTQAFDWGGGAGDRPPRAFTYYDGRGYAIQLAGRPFDHLNLIRQDCPSSADCSPDDFYSSESRYKVAEARFKALGSPVDVRLVVNEGNIQVFLNGKKALAYTDQNPLPSGGISLGGDYLMSFDDVAVTSGFKAFRSELAWSLRPQSQDYAFKTTTTFTLGKLSNGIDPRREPVTLKLGAFTATIPPGSFKTYRQSQVPDKVRFDGVIDHVPMIVDIYSLGADRYLLWAKGSGVKLDGANLPPNITLAIGDDQATGSAISGSANFAVPEVDH